MNINKQAFEQAGVTVEDYIGWCEKRNLPKYKVETKREFFARLADGRLVKDKDSGKLLDKRPRKKKKVEWRIR